MNGRIFEHTSHTVDGRVNRTYLDLSFLTGQLSDRKRFYISEGDINYLEDYSLDMEEGDHEVQYHDE